MDPQTLGDGPLLYLGTFLFSLVSGLIPVVNIEIYLLAVATYTRGAALPIIVLATAGQSLAKYILYLAGRGLVRLPAEWMRKRLERARHALDNHPKGAESVVLFSAITGVPPIYGTSLAAGALRMPALRFLVPTTIGRFIRFVVVFFAPKVLLGVTHFFSHAS
jgi:membrane protein YqaA with SNARE-associated domain